MSLISRRLLRCSVGIHGTVTQVSSRCSDFSRDMKSQTAKTWCSMKVTSASCVSRFGVERVLDHLVAGLGDRLLQLLDARVGLTPVVT